MRILHIIDTLEMGGAENVLVGLSTGQKQFGHEVTVMPLVCPKKTTIRTKIEDNGIIVSPFLNKGSVYNPILIIKIAKVLNHFDIVHVHLFPALYWTAFAKVLCISGVPLIYTEHSTNNKRRNNFIFHLVDRAVYKHGYKMVIACAEKVLDTYKMAFPNIKHTCYINNGVDTSLYKDAIPYTKGELLGIEEDVILITMVARFMPMKRQDTIVEAIAKLPNSIHAVFVGGNEKDEGLIKVRKMAESKGIYDRVHFLYIRNDVPRILKTSDMIIMASDYEGLSLSSIEGMAAGKPFIATDVDGLREVVNGAGLLFKNKDSDALVKIIEDLTTNSEYYNRIANRCLARASNFDVYKMVKLYMDVYNNTIKNKNNDI